MARVKLLVGIDSGAFCPTESHISTLPFGKTAWKIGTTPTLLPWSVGITELHEPPWPGSWAAAAETLAFATF